MKAVFVLLVCAAGAVAQTPALDRATLLAQIRALNAEQKTDLDAGKATIDILRSEVVKLTMDATAAKQAKADVDAQVAALDTWGKVQQKRADDAEIAAHKLAIDLAAEKASHQATLDRYHRLKSAGALIVAALALVVGLFIGFKLVRLFALIGPSAWLAPVVVALIASAGGFALVWLPF